MNPQQTQQCRTSGIAVRRLLKNNAVHLGELFNAEHFVEIIQYSWRTFLTLNVQSGEFEVERYGELLVAYIGPKPQYTRRRPAIITSVLNWEAFTTAAAHGYFDNLPKAAIGEPYGPWVITPAVVALV